MRIAGPGEPIMRAWRRRSSSHPAPGSGLRDALRAGDGNYQLPLARATKAEREICRRESMRVRVPGNCRVLTLPMSENLVRQR